MGSLQGHALPGSFFLVVSLWWMVQITRRSLTCRDQRSAKFYTSSAYPCGWGRCTRWPLEAIIKMAMTTFGMIGELYASTDFGRAGKIVWMGDIQHVTMYSFFWLSGLTDILVHKRVRSAPLGMDYLVASMAFVAEAILFSTHLHGRSPVDLILHTLLVYVILLCALAILMEYKWHNSIILAYTRTYFVALQGTWFWQAGFILYPPRWMNRWKEDTTDEKLLAVCIFAWHMVAVFILLMLVAGFTTFSYNRWCPATIDSIEYEVVKIQRLRMEEEFGVQNDGSPEDGAYRLVPTEEVQTHNRLNSRDVSEDQTGLIEETNVDDV